MTNKTFMVTTTKQDGTFKVVGSVYSADALEGNYSKNEIPARVNTSKVSTYTNDTGETWVTTITRLS